MPTACVGRAAKFSKCGLLLRGKSRLGDFVVMRLFLGKVVPPLVGGPNFKVVVNSEQDDLFMQSGERRQFGRNAHAALRVQFRLLGLGIKQTQEGANILPCRRRLGELIRKAGKCTFVVNRQGAIGARGYI